MKLFMIFTKGMTPNSHEKIVNVGLHALTWCLLLAIPVFFFSNRSFEGLSHIFFIVTNIAHIGLFYLNAFFLYPKLLTKRWWWLYLISLGLLVFAAYWIKIFILQTDPGFELTAINRRIIFFGPAPFLVASIIFRLVYDRLHFEKKEKEAQAEKLSAELKFLRSQISPHFIFNVMSNLVALARQKSDLLEPSLIRLSELLRYMLYETGKDRFPIDAETEYLKNYISLQQLRFGDDVRVESLFDIDEKNCFIEPMLLVPFVENAFKHGIGLVKDPYINIQLRVRNGELFFQIINNYDQRNTSKDSNQGIGLENIKKRLNLLYSGKYNLDITDDHRIYRAALKLELAC
jgi:two-component system, LytTR family, sensor kinase